MVPTYKRTLDDYRLSHTLTVPGLLIDELRSVVVQTVLKPMKLISYETYTRLCSSEWSLLSVAEVTTWRAKGTEM